MVNPLEYIALRTLRIFRRLHLMRLISLGTSERMFKDIFKGFEKVAAVRAIFGEKTDTVLQNLKVEVTWFGYMGVDNEDGHMFVNGRYLNEGDKTDIYLDVVHELCHVKQWMEHRELFDPEYDYVDRPTEIEAYRYTVQEAIRIGLDRKRILGYLKTEWMSQQDLNRLVKNMGINF